MDTNSSELDDINVTTQPAKRKRKTSVVWEHFTMETVSPGITKACCNHCHKSFAYMTDSKISGTSHLKRHIELGICAKSKESLKVLPTKDEITSYFPKKRQSASLNVPFDQDSCNHEMAKMIIMHDYPLHMVDHPGFIGFVQALRPQFSVASFNTVHGDCISMFLSQKQKLLEFIGEIPGGVNLTVDLWSSKQSVGYAFVTGHFVDKDWNLTHVLLNVAVVASPDSDSALNQTVAACLSDWKLEGKISSLATDQSIVNKTSVDNLRGFLSVRNQYGLNGQFLMVKCYARLLSSMAQDALTVEQLQEPINKVRDSIKYVKTNEACGNSFDELKRRFPTPSSNEDLLIDNQTRWDTSYEMLLAACEHRQVFSNLEAFHPEYKISISSEEWRKIESLCSRLKVLFEASNFLTGPNHLTANDLYHEMAKLQLELSHVADGEDLDVKNLSNLLREKFDQYWRGCFLVLSVAVVMDPRFKMHLVKFTFTKSYGEDADQWIKIVDDAVHDLYLNYSEQNLLDGYVDHGFAEAEVAQELHFHQDKPEDVNAGNEQAGDETSPQVEQTTESHQHERQLKVQKQNVVGLWEGVSEESQPTEEEQQHGDDSQVLVVVKEEHTSFPVDHGFSDAAVAQELHFHQDKLEDVNAGNEQAGDETSPQVVVKEDHKSFPVDHGFSEAEVAQELHFHQDKPEDVNAGNEQAGDETSPQVEQTTESHQHERQLKVQKQNVVGLWEGVCEESQPTEEEQQHGDDSQALVVVKEEHTSFLVDELLEEGSTLITVGESLSDIEMYMSEIKTELDQYLEETLIPRSEDFSVLSWWKLNSNNYPTLSKMAADLLSVPFTTVSPDSVFNTEVKQMDNYRTSLPHVTLEALLCTKDWLKNGTI